MKKSIPVLMLLFALVTPIHAQLYNNKWYLKEGAFLDFNSGKPVYLHIDSLTKPTLSYTGHASISDENGNLLFYTDAITVRNARHQAMPNGTLSNGMTSISQSSLIVTDPANKDQYYLFTSDNFGKGLFYSVIDMTLDQGRGDIGTLKNIKLLDDILGLTTAIRLSNGNDFWILAHDRKNSFYAFKLTAGGINPVPVITTIGNFYNSSYVGHLKHTKKGDKLVLTNLDKKLVELFDFDKVTGMVTNPVSSQAVYPNIYGAEFSPDDSRLYISGGDSSKTYLYQLNMKAGTTSGIFNSAILIARPENNMSYSRGQIGGLQLGPDCKIYAAKENVNSLGVINEPNVLGKGCNYVDNQVFFPKYYSQEPFTRDLPNFFEMPCCASKKDFLGNDTSLCLTPAITLDAGIADSYIWSTGSNNSSIVVTTPGNYWVNLTVDECIKKDSIVVSDCKETDIEPEVEFPNVFTPNNDGQNDRFKAINYKGITNSSLRIYNRWGSEMLNTTDVSKGWDGMFNGNPCAAGTYFWTLQYTTNAGKVNYLKGFTTLVY